MSDLVVDSSAVVALLTGEPTAAAVLRSITDSDTLHISAASLVELGIVLETRLGPIGSAVISRLLRDAGVTVVHVDQKQADVAVDAWRRFGKGRHPAGLNYGDTFTYALAWTLGAPILCVGDDFARTDIPVIDLS